MMPIRTYFASTLGVLLTLEVACSSERELEVWEGEYVLYESSPELQVCEGTHSWVDGFVPFVALELGLDIGKVQRYRWLTDIECPSWAAGCAKEIQAVSRGPFLHHELVHTVLNSLGYPYQPFFGEGIAFALDPWSGDDLRLRYLAAHQDTEKLPDPRPWMVLGNKELHYPTAGSFVLFLLARHGPEMFLDFMRELNSSREMASIERVFSAVYGLSLTDEAEAYMNGVPCAEQWFGPGVYDCTAPEILWDGARWSFRGTMDCSSEEVAGGVSSDKAWPSIRSVTLAVPTSGRYLVQIEGEGSLNGVQIGPCSSCPWERRDAILLSPIAKELDLQAGIHFMRIRANSDEAPSFDISLSPVSLGNGSP